MNMFMAYEKVKPDIGNIRDINLAVFKLMTNEVSKAQL
jgi:hypothetical protein